MKECIERAAVETMLENAQIITDGENCGYCTEDVNLGSIPAADVAEVRHGRWKNGGNGLYDTCLACGKEIYLAIPMNYCPECGALMDGKEDEDGQDPIKRSASDH